MNVFHIGARGNPIRGWGKDVQIIGFEADYKEAKRLQEVYPDHKFFHAIIGEDCEFHSLYITKKPECTSILKPMPENWVQYGRASRAEVLEVKDIQTQSLDCWCSINEIYPDFIKIDIQGYELKALRGYSHLEYVAGIETEVYFSNLYHDQDLFFKTYEYLNDKGFELFRIAQCTWGGTLIFGDALFLNRNHKHFRFFADKYKVEQGMEVKWIRG